MTTKEELCIPVFTTFVSGGNLATVVREYNYLPILAIRNLSNDNILSGFNNTAIHFKEFSPSNELFHSLKDGEISRDDYLKSFALELTGINLRKELHKIKMLCRCSQADGVVIFGYGTNPEKCHRKTLTDYLNNSGMLEYRVKELIM